jgi:hypothetical protein
MKVTTRDLGRTKIKTTKVPKSRQTKPITLAHTSQHIQVVACTIKIMTQKTQPTAKKPTTKQTNKSNLSQLNQTNPSLQNWAGVRKGVPPTDWKHTVQGPRCNSMQVIKGVESKSFRHQHSEKSRSNIDHRDTGTLNRFEAHHAFSSCPSFSL